MWRPEDGWEPLPGGRGTSTGGVWLDPAGETPTVVKRLLAPVPGDPAELSDPTHPAWWKRPAVVALRGLVDSTAGVRGVPVRDVAEDPEGITMRFAYAAGETLPGLFLASRLGAFAGNAVPDVPWLARDQLRSRLARVEWRGGWRTLSRTSIADAADRLWNRRGTLLARLDALPQVLQHGDPVPANFTSRVDDAVLALDWGSLGTGPVGGDLGYVALTVPASLEVLLDAYLEALPPGAARAEDALLGARVTAVYTALNRAEWALARVADGEGALAGKFRHPSVLPHLRTLQRQFAHLEALL